MAAHFKTHECCLALSTCHLLHGSYCPTPPGQVYQVTMWMQDFKHPTPKRSLLVSNTSGIADMLPGKRVKKRSRKAKFPTSVKYKNKQGKSCWKGSPQLKSTQTLDMTLVDLFDSCITSFCSSLVGSFLV